MLEVDKYSDEGCSLRMMAATDSDWRLEFYNILCIILVSWKKTM